MTKPTMILMLAFGATLVQADQGADIKAIQAQYLKLSRAIKSKSVPAMMAICERDFTWVDPSGKVMDRKTFEAMNRSQMKMPGLKFHVFDFKNDSFGFMGDECMVRNTTTMKMSAKMNGQTMTMSGTTECVDYWRRTPRGWRPYKVVVVHETQSMGG